MGQQPPVLVSQNNAAGQQDDINMTNQMKKQFLQKMLVMLKKNSGDG